MRRIIVTRFAKSLNPATASRWLTILSLILLLFNVSGVPAREVTLVWEANTEPILGGYRLYYGLAHRNYTSVIDVGNQTTFTIFGLSDDTMHCFAVTAYDTTKTIESAFSNEVAVMPATLSVIDGSSPAGSSDNNVVLATDWACR